MRHLRPGHYLAVIMIGLLAISGLSQTRNDAVFNPPGRTKTSGCTVNNGLPDSRCTPGAVSLTDKAAVCELRTSALRNTLTRESTRVAVFSSYGIPLPVPVGAYELDHLIPLELGGSEAIENLWPQAVRPAPAPGFMEKDKVENYLHSQVCGGRMTLAEAQRRIATNWVAEFRALPR